MKKLVTFVAATTLLVSSFAFATEGQTTTTSNDVLQTIPHDNTTGTENVTVADASTAAPASDDAMKAEDNKAAEPKAVKKHHCNKHHCKKHHHRHHQKRVKMSGPSQPNDSTPTQH